MKKPRGDFRFKCTPKTLSMVIKSRSVRSIHAQSKGHPLFQQSPRVCDIIAIISIEQSFAPSSSRVQPKNTKHEDFETSAFTDEMLLARIQFLEKKCSVVAYLTSSINFSRRGWMVIAGILKNLIYTKIIVPTDN